MDVAWMYSMFLTTGGFDTDDISIDDFLVLANTTKNEDWGYIISAVKSNYNWDTWKVQDWDIVVWQTEYRRPEAASDTEWNLKINQVSICYDGDTYSDGSKIYVPARPVNPNTLPKHWDYYVKNQPKSNPIYFTADKSIFIAPAFTQVTEQGIELRGIKSIPEWTSWMTEAQTKLPYYLHTMVVYGAIKKAKEGDSRFDEAQYFAKEHETLRTQAYINISNVSTWPSFMTYPDNYETTDNIID